MDILVEDNRSPESPQKRRASLHRSGGQGITGVLTFFVLMVIFFSCNKPTQPDHSCEFVVFHDHLKNGFALGINTGEGRRDWAGIRNDEIRMFYPSGQGWGSVFVVVGLVVDPPRPSLDFSGFQTISLELRGVSDQATLLVGINDKDDEDDEPKYLKQLALTKNWKVYEIELSEFSDVELGKLYTVAEFVFEGMDAKVAYCRDIRYAP